MSRIRWLFMLMSLIPQSAFALQLHWSSGATDLSFLSATRCTLVVQADSAEAALPNSWRLQWAADTSDVQFPAVGSLACLADTAKVDSIVPPSTPADSAVNLTTAYFCSSGSSNATVAYFLADLPGTSHGRMKVVALNPADTTQVIESNEVTFNGGIDGGYAPLVLSASSVHQSLQLSVSVVGADLAAASSLSIAAPNGSWNLGLESRGV